MSKHQNGPLLAVIPTLRVRFNRYYSGNLYKIHASGKAVIFVKDDVPCT